jgi:hypothetical protein
MHDIHEVKAALAHNFRAAGFKGSRTMWNKVGASVAWVCHVARPFNGPRLSVDVGLTFDPESPPRLPSDCDIFGTIESLVPNFRTPPYAKDEYDLDDSDVFRALDISSSLYWEQRLGYLAATIEALGYYVDSRMTRDALRDALAAGEFRQYVSTRARDLLAAP